MLTRSEATEKLEDWTKGDSLRDHARAVEIVMRAAAAQYGEGEADEERWGLTGYLHDADYEQWPEEHPTKIVAWLRERGETEMADAIAGHYTHWGVPRETRLARALIACDELTGFIVACALVRPEGIHTLTPKSVKKKLKNKAFAAKVDRDEVRIGMEELEVDPTEHIQFVIDALRPHAEELGIAGKALG